MLSMAERIACLKKTELFAGLLERELKIFAEISEDVHLTDDQTIFNEGEKSDAVYFAVSGQVKLCRSGIELTRRGQNECIGVAAVIVEEPRGASVSSVGDSVLLRIDRDAFYRAAHGNEKVLQNIIRIEVERIQEERDREIEAELENERLKHDLARASELQMAMLPTEDLQITTPDGLPIVASGNCHPMEKVGGDCFDYFTLPDDQLGLVIGDVMGHGYHTGLLVSTAMSCLHTQLRADCGIESVMDAMNDVVYGFVHGDMYMTYCYVIVDLENHTASFCNAGHCYPYHYRAGKGELGVLESEAMPLGMFDNQEYEITTSEWGKGDIFVLYTDGIIETENDRKEPFGEERLKRLILKNAHQSAAELKEKLLSEFDDFLQGAKREDDVTLVIVKMGL
ncbi:SpoIIE family protein phosphatase [Candidatus Poribacteria bacterium]